MFRSMARASAPILVCVAALACGGPLVMVPGGELSGTAKPTPADWSFTDDVETVQVETRPADPYSVNVWGVAADGAFYVAAAKATNTWAQHIADDPNVRLRVGDDLYELRAVRVDSEAERGAFLAAAKRKYDFEPEEGQASEAALFRLVAR